MTKQHSTQDRDDHEPMMWQDDTMTRNSVITFPLGRRWSVALRVAVPKLRASSSRNKSVLTEDDADDFGSVKEG